MIPFNMAAGWWEFSNHKLQQQGVKFGSFCEKRSLPSLPVVLALTLMELVSQRLVPLDQAVSQLCCTCSCFQLVLSIFHKSFHSGAISTTRILYLGILTELHFTPSQHSKCHGIAIYPHFLQYLYMAELVKDQFIKLGCFAPVCNDADILNDKMINIRTRIRKVSTKILWNANYLSNNMFDHLNCLGIQGCEPRAGRCN